MSVSDPATIQGSVKLITLLLKEAEKQGLIDRLKLIFKAKPRILLLGCTGAGKSNFLKSLTVESPEAIPREARTQFTTARNIVLKSKHPY